MLESLEDPDVRRMYIEAPESQAPDFDIESEITDEDWDGMVKSAEDVKGREYIHRLYPLKVLSPSRFSELQIDALKVQDGYTELKRQIENLSDIGQGIPAVIELAKRFQALGNKIEPELLSRLGTVAKEALNRFVTTGTAKSVIIHMANMKLLGLPYNLDSRIGKILFDREVIEVEHLRVKINSSFDNFSDLFLLANEISELSIVFPEKALPSWTNKDYELAKRAIVIVRSQAVTVNNYSSFSVLAAELRLAFADKIVMDDDGLHAVYNSNDPSISLQPSNPPEQRNF